MKDEIVFALFKDEEIHSMDYFKFLTKKINGDFNISKVYIRIINYQIEKYGISLSGRRKAYR